MAWHEFDEKSGYYRIRFRYPPQGGTKFNLSKSLKIQDEDTANSKCVIVEETIRLLMRGTLKVPGGVDVGEFIVSGGTLTAQQVVAEGPKATTLKELFEAYVREMSAIAERAATLKTEGYHIAHLSTPKLLGDNRAVVSINESVVQDYINTRSKQLWRGKRIKRDTIEKELETLGAIWRWGMRRGLVGVVVPWQFKNLKFPFAEEREKFRIYDQIERRIKRGGLTDDQQAELWGCLFLTGQQVADVPDTVETNAAEPFVYPMFAFVALTGARRGELLRSLIDDFDFDAGSVTIRGTKGRQRTTLVTREVDIHPRLRRVMTDWFSCHPGGQRTLCRADGTPLTVDAANYHFAQPLKGTKWEVTKGFHVFRHSMASILASNGEDQRFIDKYLGHQTEAMRKRYQHLFPTVDRRPIDSLLPGV